MRGDRWTCWPVARLEAGAACAPRSSSGWPSSCRSCSTARFLLHRYYAIGAGVGRAAGAADCAGAERRHRSRDHGDHHHAGDAAPPQRARRTRTSGASICRPGGAEIASVERALSSTPIAANSSIRGCPGARRCPSVPSTEPDLVRIARETGQPYVSDLFDGYRRQALDLLRQRSRASAQGRQYALVMSLEPERLVEILKGESLPPGWLAAMADRKNINMARTRLAEEFLGRPMPRSRCS